jgi:hypothetical protein
MKKITSPISAQNSVIATPKIAIVFIPSNEEIRVNDMPLKRKRYKTASQVSFASLDYS